MKRLCAALLGLLACYHLAGVLVLIPDRQSDFQMFYESARLWWSGAGAYAPTGLPAPNLNHPLLLPLVLPFATLPFQWAALLWTLGSMASGGICLWVTARRLGIAWGPLALVLFSTAPTALALGLGQVSFVLLPILTAAWLADRDGRESTAGGWLGLLTVFKPFYGLYGVYLLWRRSWAALAAYVGTIAAGYALGFLCVGVDGYRAWIRLLRDVDWQGHLYNTSVWGVAARWFTPSDKLVPVGWTPLILSPTLAGVCGWGLAAIVAGGLAWTVRANVGDRDRDYAAIALGAVLLSPLGWLHYLVVAVPPIVAVWARQRSAAWAVPIALAAVPSVLIVGRIYGTVGTGLWGVWAIGIAGSLLLLVAMLTAGRSPARVRHRSDRRPAASVPHGRPAWATPASDPRRRA